MGADARLVCGGDGGCSPSPSVGLAASQLCVLYDSKPGQEALRHCFEIHRESSYRIAFHILHDPHASEEVVEDTWIKMLEKPPEHPVRWFKVVTARRAIDLYRKRKREDRNLPSRAGRREGQHASDVSATLVEREAFERFGEVARARLTEDEQKVFVLRFHLGWSFDTIAECLAMNLNTAKSIHLRALKKIRGLLCHE